MIKYNWQRNIKYILLHVKCVTFNNKLALSLKAYNSERERNCEPIQKTYTRSNCFVFKPLKIMLGISMFSDEHVTRKQISFSLPLPKQKSFIQFFSPSTAFNYPFVRIFVDLRKPKIVWVPKIKWFSFEEIPENDGSVWRSGKLNVLEPINT